MKVIFCAFCLVLLSALGLSSATTARADTGSDNIYCIIADVPHSTVYYSNVFQGDRSALYRYMRPFANYVNGNYSGVGAITSLCYSKASSSDARDAIDQDKSFNRITLHYKSLIDTGWSY